MGKLSQRAFPRAMALCTALLHLTSFAGADGGMDPPLSESPSAAERDEQEARAAFQRGDELYLEGDYEGAVSAFEEAYAKSGRIEMLFNLANAHERLGHYAEAALSLRGYIPHSPEHHRPALERRLARLSRLADEKRAPAQSQLESSPAPQHPKAAWKPSLGVGLSTLGGAGLLTGAGFALATLGARKQLNAICTQGASGRICPPEAGPYLSRDRSYSLVADIALLAGAALATTGIVLMVYQSKESRSEVSVQPGIASFWLRGAF